MKIKSISDVITNSSTEVFVMTPSQLSHWKEEFKNDPEYEYNFGWSLIDYKWVEENLGREYNLICNLFGLDKDDLDKNKIKSSSLLGKVYFIEIQDHFELGEHIDKLILMRKDTNYFYEWRH